MRQPRFTIPGSAYHVISRLVDRSWFISADEERHRYLELLGKALRYSDWRCLAFAVMSNHVHLLFVAGMDSGETIFRRTNSPFAAWMNRRHGRIGPIFTARPMCWRVRDSDEPRVLAYIHNNPVRAGVVERACESAWTSHRHYVDESGPEWLDRTAGLARCEIQDPASFDQWVDCELSAPRMLFGQRELQGIRQQAHRRGAIEIATIDAGAVHGVPLVARPFARVHADPSDVIAWLARRSKVSFELVRSRRQLARLLDERRLAMRVGRALGLSISQMCDALGVSASTGSRLAVAELTIDEQTIAAIAGRYLATRGPKGKASPQ